MLDDAPSSPASPSASAARRLIVFSDDWGRHPSSCQHLVRHLLECHPTLWANTIGTRMPRLTLADAAKVVEKLRQWLGPSRHGGEAGPELPANLTVIAPRMYPGFRRRWQRRFNARSISRSVNDALGPRRPGEQRTVVTTVPITADLPGRLDADRWVYYCVDDFSVWPGLDGQVLGDLEGELVPKVDAVVAASETLQQRIAGFGREASLLTHGIDLDHWGFDPQTGTATPPASTATGLPHWWSKLTPPVLLFWGVVDRRLDLSWCEALSKAGGTLALVGPHQDPPPELADLPNAALPGPAPYDLLPALADAADLLVMPYADLPVTRAMQPLKFKEYLATGKPVVARRLPSNTDWADAADLVDDVEALVDVVRDRLDGGLPDDQRRARRRLADETWSSKAAQFEQVLFPASPVPGPQG